MPDLLEYKEERRDGSWTVSLRIEGEDTNLRAVGRLEDGDELVLEKISETESSYLSRSGFPMIAPALAELHDRGFDVDAGGLLQNELFDTSSTPVNEGEEPNVEESAVSTPESEDSEPAEESDDELVQNDVQEDVDELLDEFEEDLEDEQLSTREKILDILHPRKYVTVEDLAEAVGVKKGTIYGYLSELDDNDLIEKRKLEGTTNQKEYRLSEGRERWCGLCGFSAGSNNGIITHHGRKHGDPDPVILEEEPDEPVAEHGYWCGRCGDGPFEESLDIEDHHDRKHGAGDAIALEEEPGEEDLVEPENGFQTWSGKTVADGGAR